jgi:long-chain acyl-CoA synthetase
MNTMEITRVFDILNMYQTPERSGMIALAGKRDGKWIEYTGEDYIEQVNRLSQALVAAGIGKGDMVATILKNCPEWNIIDMALLRIGAVQVPVYPTISDSNYNFIFNDAGVKMIFVSDESIFSRIREVITEVPSIGQVVAIEPTAGTMHWDELMAGAVNGPSIQEIEAVSQSVGEHDMATLIYTSGTTGNPKGVMLSHRNLVSNSDASLEIINQQPMKKALSFLPLCHVLERIMSYTYQRHGASIYYCDNLEQIGDFIRETKPEIFTAVPRVLEKTYEKIVAKGRALSGLKKMLFFWALNLGEQYEPWGKHSAWYMFRLKIARKLIFSKWHAALGGKLQTIVSGGASLQERIARVFWAAGFKVIEGYGLTETSPVIAVGNFLPGGVLIGTVGPLLPGVDVKIAEDGEILCKGPNVMLGYYKRPDLTAEIIDEEGWLHTGDIGHFEGKFLRITDRKKEMFKTSGGKYIAPQQVENHLKESSFIENALVVGEGKNFAAAIIMPNFAHIESWCNIKGIPYTGPKEVVKNDIVINRIQREVLEINKALDQVEQVKKFRLIADTWAIETGELSPTMKLKRKFLNRKYALLIEQIYAGVD